MGYVSVATMAAKWNISERSVRNYCASGRIEGATLEGKTWKIPEDANKPKRHNEKKEKQCTLREILQDEKKRRYRGGIFLNVV